MADTDPYAGKDDVQVLEMAKQALLKASALPPESIERAIWWGAFDAHMRELDRRAAMHVLAMIHQRNRADLEVIIDQEGTCRSGGRPGAPGRGGYRPVVFHLVRQRLMNPASRAARSRLAVQTGYRAEEGKLP